MDSLSTETPTVSHILICEDELHQRIAQLGAAISEDYADKGQLALVCLLKGGIVFLSDLMRRISIPHQVELMQVSSYGMGARDSTGEVQFDPHLNLNIAGKHVLIVEDIVDTGYTLDAVGRYLWSFNPVSVETCVLLDKPERRKVEVPVKYTGFSIPDEFVVGFGIDADEMFRHLPYIAAVAG